MLQSQADHAVLFPFLDALRGDANPDPAPPDFWKGVNDGGSSRIKARRWLSPVIEVLDKREPDPDPLDYWKGVNDGGSSKREAAPEAVPEPEPNPLDYWKGVNDGGSSKRGLSYWKGVNDGGSSKA